MQTQDGGKQIVNFDHKYGDIRFTARDGLEDVILKIKCTKDLWYHSDLRIVQDQDASEPAVSDSSSDPSSVRVRVNFLSDAAKFELWHQCLGHIGKSKLEILHKHCDGVPFYKCPACMAGKFCTKNPVCNANLGTTSTPGLLTPARDLSHHPVDHPTFAREWDNIDSDDDVDEWEAYLNELHLPDTKPGMNFHADFGFVCSSEFSLKTESGKKQSPASMVRTVTA